MAVARQFAAPCSSRTTPLLFGVLPPADSLHQAAPKTGKHLIIIVEAGTFVLGVGQEDQVERLSRTRRYMARKTQGKAQMNHTAKGGRQSYGARLRQRETKAFLKEAVAALKDAVQTLDESNTAGGIARHVCEACSERKTPKFSSWLRRVAQSYLGRSIS